MLYGGFHYVVSGFHYVVWWISLCCIWISLCCMKKMEVKKVLKNYIKIQKFRFI